MGILNDRNRVKGLGKEDLEAFCQTLWLLMCQSEPSTRILMHINRLGHAVGHHRHSPRV